MNGKNTVHVRARNGSFLSSNVGLLPTHKVNPPKCFNFEAIFCMTFFKKSALRRQKHDDDWSVRRVLCTQLVHKQTRGNFMLFCFEELRQVCRHGPIGKKCKMHSPCERSWKEKENSCSQVRERAKRGVQLCPRASLTFPRPLRREWACYNPIASR